MGCEGRLEQRRKRKEKRGRVRRRRDMPELDGKQEKRNLVNENRKKCMNQRRREKKEENEREDFFNRVKSQWLQGTKN